MSSSTPSSSTARRPDRNDAHPYAVKTTHTGILARSNSSKAHGSWARHQYTPSSPSPSAKAIFNPSEGSPSPTRQTTVLPQDAKVSPSNKSQTGNSAFSTASPSKIWVAYTAEGEEVQLPKHPYLWSPSQLTSYLSLSLKDKDGEPLDINSSQRILKFVNDQRIGGRAFLSLDEEDFQELEGLDWDANNALWDAACTLRQQTLPHRASRISSTSYKRGRVKGIVDVFERSASESSDVGEDSLKGRTSTPKQVNGHTPMKMTSDGGSGMRRKNTFWDMSESESDAEKIVWDLERRSKPPLSQDTFPHERHSDPEKVALLNGFPQMVTIISKASGHPVDAVVALPSEHLIDKPPETNTDFPEDDSETPHNSREVDINSAHHEEEPTMAELYEQTFGEPAPSPRTVPVDIPPSGATMQMSVSSTPSPNHIPSGPPTALRPVKRKDKEIQSAPLPALANLFMPKSVEHLQNIFLVPRPTSPRTRDDRDEIDLQTVTTLRARLEQVEKRLAEVERAESERIQRSISERSLNRANGSRKRQKRKVPKEQILFEDDLDPEFRRRPSKTMRIARDIFYGDGEGDFRSSLRTWQSTYIILAGATTGVSILLLPMLLRHFWTR